LRAPAVVSSTAARSRGLRASNKTSRAPGTARVRASAPRVCAAGVAARAGADGAVWTRAGLVVDLGKLGNVLRAIAALRPEIGYRQV